MRRQPLDESFRWHHDLTRKGLLAADAVIAPTAAYAAAVQACYRLPVSPQVVHNGRTPIARPRSAARPIRAALTVGRLWDEAKNTAVLDRAAERIEVPFLAVGALRGPRGESFSAAALQALGYMTEARLATLLELRPVFVTSARFEPFGLAVLEAAEAGCALVLSDIPTFRELWEDAAVFVAAHDHEAFAVAVQELLDDPARRTDMQERARRRSQRYSPAAMARGTANIYAGLTQREAAA